MTCRKRSATLAKPSKAERYFEIGSGICLRLLVLVAQALGVSLAKPMPPRAWRQRTKNHQALSIASVGSGVTQRSWNSSRLGERLWIAPSCSLLHVPVDLDSETKLNGEIESWLAFAKQKL